MFSSFGNLACFSEQDKMTGRSQKFVPQDCDVVFHILYGAKKSLLRPSDSSMTAVCAIHGPFNGFREAVVHIVSGVADEL